MARGRGPGGCICLWRCPHITGAGGGILGVFCTVGASWGGSTWVCTLEGGSALGAHLGGGFCPGFVLGGGHLNCICTLGGPALGVQLGRGSSGGVVPCMGHGGVSALGGHLGRGSALGVQFEGGVHPEGGMNGGLHRVCTSEGWVWERSSTFGPCALCTYVRMCVHTRLLCKGSGPPWHMLQLFWGAGGLYEAPMFVPVHGQSSVTGLGDAPAFFFSTWGCNWVCFSHHEPREVVPRVCSRVWIHWQRTRARVCAASRSRASARG